MARSQVAMDSLITIGDYEFKNQCNSVEVFSSFKILTDWAVIKLPNFQDENKVKLEKLIKVGDAVTVMLGYDDELYKEYEGYVTQIVPGAPLEIRCEDEMWMLKQVQVNKSWKSISLKEMLREILPTGTTIECPDIVLSPYKIDRVSVAKALEQLKEEFLLVAYFRDKKLYVGLAYQEKNNGEVNYHFQKNALMVDLTYMRKEDIRVKVKAISMQHDGKSISVEVGDGAIDEDFKAGSKVIDAEQVTIHWYNKTKAELKVLAKEAINKLKYDGYRGAFKAKGIPRPKHSMVANLMDDKYPERVGSFFIDSIKTTYNRSTGFTREIELGRSSTAKLIE